VSVKESDPGVCLLFRSEYFGKRLRDPPGSRLTVFALRYTRSTPASRRSLAKIRRMPPETIIDGGFGCNSTDLHEDRESWGLPAEIDGNGRPKQGWLPRGIVIPWRIKNDLWRINIRWPVVNPKYIRPGVGLMLFIILTRSALRNRSYCLKGRSMRRS
jgi:hypothetical protein